MNFDKYYNNLPLSLEITGKTDEVKLLTLFAYNYYFNADDQYIDELADGICFERGKGNWIDGIFLDKNLDEDRFDLISSIYTSDDGILSYNDINNRISNIESIIKDAERKYYTFHNKTSEKIQEMLEMRNNPEGDSVNQYCIKILTNKTLSAKDAYEINTLLENRKSLIKNLTYELVDGSVIQQYVDSNSEPYNYVPKGLFNLDRSDNILKYSDNSYVCNISALSLKDIWDSDGKKGLLAMNLRYYIVNKNIDEKIKNSIQNQGDNFWYYNNGIIIVCDDAEFKNDQVILKNFSIVNGGQTTRMIGTIPFEKDFYIVCKIVVNNFKNSDDKNAFIASVAEASNTQKPIKAKDIIANRVEQRNLKTLFNDNKIFIEIKRGEKYDHELYKEPYQRTKNNELAQDLYAFVYLQPGPARNNVNQILQNNDKYDTIFVNHNYSFGFLKDVLFLEKSFADYQKFVKKNKKDNAVLSGLTKNGKYYVLSIIGYLLKLKYNDLFKDDVYKNRFSPIFTKYYGEQAFNSSFIIEQDYKQFSKTIMKLYDYVMGNLMIPAFNNALENNPSLVYSNFTKTNSAFLEIQRYINREVFDFKDTKIFNYLDEFFKTLSEEETKKSLTLYNENILNNKNKVVYGLSDTDVELKNKLAEFRLIYSREKHIKAYYVFTNKQLDEIIKTKPQTLDDLIVIIGDNSAHYVGDSILKIIQECL